LAVYMAVSAMCARSWMSSRSAESKRGPSGVLAMQAEFFGDPRLTATAAQQAGIVLVVGRQIKSSVPG